MDKVIVSGLLLIASVAAAVITISIITPALGSDNESIVRSNEVASTLTSTGFDGLTAVVDDASGLNISAWFKNVGSVDIDPISEIDVFLLTGNRLSGRYIPYSDVPIATDRWDAVLPGNSSVWARGDTLQIKLTLESSSPISIGRYKISLTTPIGVSGDIFFEYGPIPTPTLTPTPTPAPNPPGMSLSQAVISINETGTGNVGTFTVELNSQPTSEVVLSVTPSDASEIMASPNTMTFTQGNWADVQVITVTGVFDGVSDGDQLAEIELSVVVGSSADEYDDVSSSVVDVTIFDVACESSEECCPLLSTPTPTPSVDFAIGDEVSGDLSVVGEIDIWDFYAESGSPINIYMWTPLDGVYVDTLIRLRDPNSREIAANDDRSSAVDQAFRDGVLSVEPTGRYNSAILLFNPSESGVYSLSAGSYANRGQGDYLIKVTCAPPPPPIEVLPILVGEEVSGDLTRSGETDEWTFEAIAGSFVTIYMWTPVGGISVDTYLRLRNPEGVQVAYNDDNNAAVIRAYEDGLLDVEPVGRFNSAIIEHTILTTGTYTIVADSYRNDGIGDYRIKLIIP